jgi:hypothetical protein
MIYDDLIFRLRERARIRRQIATRKSVQNGEPDRLSDLLEEAANEIEKLKREKVLDELVAEGQERGEYE